MLVAPDAKTFGAVKNPIAGWILVLPILRVKLLCVPVTLEMVMVFVFVGNPGNCEEFASETVLVIEAMKVWLAKKFVLGMEKFEFGRGPRVRLVVIVGLPEFVLTYVSLCLKS